MTDRKDTADQLAKALPYLTSEIVAEISPKFRYERFDPDELIILQGNIADRFYIIISGEVDIWHEGLDGQNEIVDTRKPGEYFGETGLLTNRPRTATVKSSPDNPVEVLVMDSQDFEEMMKDSKATEMHVAQEMIQRLIKLADAQ